MTKINIIKIISNSILQSLEYFKNACCVGGGDNVLNERYARNPSKNQSFNLFEA